MSFPPGTILDQSRAPLPASSLNFLGDYEGASISDRMGSFGTSSVGPNASALRSLATLRKRLTQHVWDLRRRDPKVTVITCRRQQDDCRSLLDQRFKQGEDEFQEIKAELVSIRNQIERVEDSREQQHRMVIKHLLDLKR